MVKMGKGLLTCYLCDECDKSIPLEKRLFPTWAEASKHYHDAHYKKQDEGCTECYKLTDLLIASYDLFDATSLQNLILERLVKHAKKANHTLQEGWVLLNKASKDSEGNASQ